MMQRKDLAKEFSLVVQQEIVNHNKSILATNLSVNSLREAIELLSKVTDKKMMDQVTQFSESLKVIGDFHEKQERGINALFRTLNETNLNQEKNLQELKKSISTRESYFLTHNVFESFQKKVDQWLANLRVSFSSQKEVFSQEIRAFENLINEKLVKLSDDIQRRFRLETEENKDISRSMDTMAINFSGLVKEVERLKKRDFIFEKNIENLYTKIERMNEKR